MATTVASHDFLATQGRNLHAYWDQVPSDMGRKMVTGFVVSAMVDIVFGAALGSSFVGAALAATATAVHALITPLFKKMVGDRQQLTWPEEMLRSGAAILGTGALATCLGQYAYLPLVDLRVSFLVTGFLNLFAHHRNVNDSNCIFPMPRLT